jgi:hypothetical protein
MVCFRYRRIYFMAHNKFVIKWNVLSSGSRSVVIVRWRTKPPEFACMEYFVKCFVLEIRYFCWSTLVEYIMLFLQNNP